MSAIRQKDRQEQRDWLTVEGAYELCQRIRDYWSERGYKVKMSMEPSGETFVVRSDMRNGHPVEN